MREARSSQTPAASSDSLIFVVIDHHAAHIYRYSRESDPGAETSITPYDPFGFHHHLIHRKETHYSGDRVPEETSYYREIAAELGHDGQIIVVGHAKGKSSAMEHLLEFLEKHYADLFKRVIETDVLDLSALTEPEIEAIVNKRMSNT